jgi:glycosyltransferase involved in cell wall biosynthesis
VLALDERPGISVVGPVPLMDPYFANAHVVVVPILTGAGIRVKIVEAMANGRAIVSTSLGWEGLPDVRPGEHLLVADEPRQFAAEVVRLLRDQPLRVQLTARARELAVREYDWRALGDRQEALLRAIAG